jgi:hypothetical protein
VAICKYCGQKAGWFSDYHSGCLTKYKSVMAAVSKAVTQTIEQHSNEGYQLFNLLKSLDRPASVSFSDLCLAALEDWQRAVDDVCYTTRTTLELTGEQITFPILFYQRLVSWLEIPVPNLVELNNRYSDQINTLKAYDTIRRICLGEGVDRLATGDPRVDSINFLAGEFPVVVAQNVRMESEQTSYVRNYGGPSFRVATGLYWRMGQSQGQSIKSFVADEGGGYLILTNIGMYYSNGTNVFYTPCSQNMKTLMWAPELPAQLNRIIGILITLRSGKRVGYSMASAHQSICFLKLLSIGWDTRKEIGDHRPER